VVSEQNRSLQIARIKQLLGPELDPGLFHRIALDLLLDGLSPLSEVSNFDQTAAAKGARWYGDSGTRLTHVDSRSILAIHQRDDPLGHFERCLLHMSKEAKPAQVNLRNLKSCC
jgi:hypothetical protein